MTQNSLFLRIKSVLFRNCGTIICLHRVGRHTALPVLAGNKYVWLSDDALDRLITLVKIDLGLTFVPLEEHLARLHAAKRTSTVSLTFDDGYRDNLSIALPVMKAHDVPATIFVATGLIDGKAPIWWSALESIAAQGQTVPLTFEEMRLLHLAAGGEAVGAALEAAGAKIDWPLVALQEMLTWDEIRKAQDEPLLTIGAHTVTHPNLKALSSDAVRFEMSTSCDRLETETGVRPRYFAYPFGSPQECGVREFKIAQEVGFDAALTTYPGNLWPQHRHKMFSLPRMALSQPQWSSAHIVNKLTGYDDFRRGRWQAF